MPGLGQIYNSQAIKGIIVYLSGFLLLFGVSVSKIQYTFNGLLILVFVMMAYYLFVIVDAIIVAKRSGLDEPKSYNKWYVYTLIFCANIVFSNIVGDFITIEYLTIKSYKIPANSMSPTIEIGDFIISDTKAYENSEPNRGDIIIFANPKDPRQDFIKRVVATSGDEIEIKNKQLFINGKEITEPYASHLDNEFKEQRDDFGKTTIPSGTYYVLGDNRDNSFDSRFLGPIKKSAIKGKALYFYFSKNADKFGKAIK